MSAASRSSCSPPAARCSLRRGVELAGTARPRRPSRAGTAPVVTCGRSALASTAASSRRRLGAQRPQRERGVAVAGQAEGVDALDHARGRRRSSSWRLGDRRRAGRPSAARSASPGRRPRGRRSARCARSAASYVARPLEDHLLVQLVDGADLVPGLDADQQPQRLRRRRRSRRCRAACAGVLRERGVACRGCAAPGTSPSAPWARTGCEASRLELGQVEAPSKVAIRIMMSPARRARAGT